MVLGPLPALISRGHRVLVSSISERFSIPWRNSGWGSVLKRDDAFIHFLHFLLRESGACRWPRSSSCIRLGHQAKLCRVERRRLHMGEDHLLQLAIEFCLLDPAQLCADRFQENFGVCISPFRAAARRPAPPVLSSRGAHRSPMLVSPENAWPCSPWADGSCLSERNVKCSCCFVFAKRPIESVSALLPFPLFPIIANLSPG